MSNFYIVATPIGNLDDISKRAITVLSDVDLILCENFKITKIILSRYKIKKPLVRYHQHSQLLEENKILTALKEGKNIALVTDAGTPGISDPGGKLIKKITKELGEKVKIVPIPGASAITCAASVSGFFMDNFLFLGFCPKKKKRRKFFEEIASSKHSVIFFESPHRILKTLKEMADIETLQKREIVVCRELTKKFETIYRGKIKEVIKEIEKNKFNGEFVVVVEDSKT